MSDIVDVNYSSHVALTGVSITAADWTPPAVPRDYSDVLKFSLCQDITVDGLTVEGGTENALDAVRGGNYTFKNSSFLGGGICPVTLKGEINGVTFDNCQINGSVELGQFSNYDKFPFTAKTKGIVFNNCRSTAGNVVTVELWNAEKPTAVGCTIQYKKILGIFNSAPWFIYFPYFCYRTIYVRIKGLKTT